MESNWEPGSGLHNTGKGSAHGSEPTSAAGLDSDISSPYEGAAPFPDVCHPESKASVTSEEAGEMILE